MFGFNNKVDLRKEPTPKANYIARNRFDEINAWHAGEEFKRYSHLKTLIIKTYETVGIKADTFDYGEILDEFTRADYIEDFAIFFDSKVFDKLKDWCREYEILKKLNNKVIYGEE